MAAPRRHGRNISHPLPRRNTNGPLGADDDPLTAASAGDPLAESHKTDSDTTTTAKPTEPQHHQPPPPPSSQSQSPPPTAAPVVDLTFLLDRDSYHILPTSAIAPSFSTSPNRPSIETPLPVLLQTGHFRRAAELAVRLLAQCSPDATLHILHLFYTRLACLILIARPDLALQEALPLLDFLNRSGPPVTDALLPIIPWDVRVLLVRLQSIGAADGGRRGIMALYALTTEVRAHLKVLRDERRRQDPASATPGTADAIDLWTSRLRDLGLRVCDALVEMGELETALRHLATLATPNPSTSLPHAYTQDLLYRRTLLHLRLGSLPAAAHCAAQLQNPLHQRSFSALLDIAAGDPSAALHTYSSLLADFPSHEAFALNAATALLYTGHITASRDALEQLLRGGKSSGGAESDDPKPPPPFPALLFNLSTIYELCNNDAHARDKKALLAQEVARRPPRPEFGGWERRGAEVKL